MLFPKSSCCICRRKEGKRSSWIKSLAQCQSSTCFTGFASVRRDLRVAENMYQASRKRAVGPAQRVVTLHPPSRKGAISAPRDGAGWPVTWARRAPGREGDSGPAEVRDEAERLHASIGDHARGPQGHRGMQTVLGALPVPERMFERKCEKIMKLFCLVHAFALYSQN